MIKPSPIAPVRLASQGLPAFAYFLLALGGPWAFLPYLRRSPSRVFRVAMILAALAPFPLAACLPCNWLFIALLLMGWNLAWTSPLSRIVPRLQAAAVWEGGN